MSTNSHPRAVLWDVDGTLLDSAELHLLSWQEALTPEGFNLTRARFVTTFGQRNDEILRGYFGPTILPADIRRIAEAKEERYRALMRAGEAVPLPGVREWLARLHAAGWRQAVASSAPLKNVEAILAALGIEQYFEAITAAEDVQRGKPDPQVFLVAAAKLNVPPARCIVIEDAPAGVEGAQRAGMRAVGVLSSQSTLVADIVVRSLDQLPQDTFDQLLADTLG